MNGAPKKLSFTQLGLLYLLAAAADVTQLALLFDPVVIIGQTVIFIIDIVFISFIIIFLYLTDRLKFSNFLVIAAFLVLETIPYVQGFSFWVLAIWGLNRVLDRGLGALPAMGTLKQFVTGRKGPPPLPGPLPKKPPALPQAGNKAKPPPLPPQTIRGAAQPPSLQQAVTTRSARITPPPLPVQDNTLTIQPKNQPVPENHLNLSNSQNATQSPPKLDQIPELEQKLSSLMGNIVLDRFERMRGLQSLQATLKNELTRETDQKKISKLRELSQTTDSVIYMMHEQLQESDGRDINHEAPVVYMARKARR